MPEMDAFLHEKKNQGCPNSTLLNELVVLDVLDLPEVTFQVPIWVKNVKNRKVSFWPKNLRPQVSFRFVSRYPYI